MTTRKNRTIKTDYPNPEPPKYRVQYGCTNCGWSGALAFEQGKPAPTSATCDKCGCSTAKKQIALSYVLEERPAPIDSTLPLIPCSPRPQPDPWRDPYDPWDSPRRRDIIFNEDSEFPPKTQENFHAHGCGRE